jgi:S1-C subfamily serine protease
VAATPPGTRVTLQVARQRDKKTVETTLAELRDQNAPAER